MIGEMEVHRWTDHGAAKNFFEKVETYFGGQQITYLPNERRVFARRGIASP